MDFVAEDVVVGECDVLDGAYFGGVVWAADAYVVVGPALHKEF